MTDRDKFAAHAMAGLIANGDYSDGAIPAYAYRLADAMLAERDKTSAGSGSVTTQKLSECDSSCAASVPAVS